MPEIQEDSPDRSDDLAIRKSNIFEKLCFVVTGTGLLGGLEDLRKELLDYHSRRGDNLVSSVGIRNWGTKSKPTREKAFRFLNEFLLEVVKYNELPPDRKKVFNQIEDFLGNALGSLADDSTSSPRLVFSNAGKLVVDPTNITGQEFSDLSDSWSGTYLSFRRRLIADQQKPYAREVIRIVRTKGGLGYRHWHLRDGHQLSMFEGIVLATKETLWMWGADQSNSRYRICHFKRNESTNPSHQLFRWGLLHSDIPMGSSRDPASTRIFLKKVDVTKHIDRFVEANVKYVSSAFEGDEESEAISRAVNNDIASQSISDWRHPLERKEEILRTSHITLESMLMTLND